MLSLLVYAVLALVCAAAAARWVMPIPGRVTCVLLLLPLVFTGGALVTDQVWAPFDLAYNSAPLSAARTEFGIERTAPGIYSDIASQIIPWRQAVRHAFAQGEWPLWNPFILGGDVLAGAAQPAPFYPPYLITMWLPLALWLGVQGSLALFLGALAAWLFLADCELSAEAALVGAAGWVFAGAVLFWIHWPVGVTTALFPLVLLGARRVVRAPGARSAVLLGLSFVLVLTSGHPETVLHVVAVAAVWAAIEWMLDRPVRPWRAVAAGVGAGATALAVSAVALLPVFEALPQTVEYDLRRNYFAGLDRSASLPDAVRHAVVQVVPFVYGTPGRAEPKVPGPWSLPGTAYAGSLLFAPALYALLRARDRRRWAWLGLGLFGLLAGVAAPGVTHLLARLPFFDIALNERLIFVAAFALSALAAYGLDAWSARRTRGLAWTALAGTVAMAAVAALLWAGLVQEGLPVEYLQGRLLAWLVPPLALGLLLLARPAARTGLVVALALLALQRQAEMGDLFPVRPVEAFYPKVAPLDRLGPEPTPYRVVGQGFELVPAAGAFYGLEDPRGYEAAHQEGDDVDGQKEHGAIPETIPDTARVIPPQQVDQPAVPTLDSLPVRHDIVGLQTQIIHPVKHGGKSGQPHRDHDALEVDSIAYMSGRFCNRTGGVQKGVNHLIESEPLLEAATFLEVVLQIVQLLAQSHDLTLFLDARQIIPQYRTVLIFSGTNVAAQGKILFLQLQTTQRLCHLGITYH